MTALAAMKQALEALKIHSNHYECEDDYYSCPASESAWEERKGECCCGADEANAAIINLRAAIEQMEKAEPVAWLPSDEWTPCVKLPVTVHVRKQREGETHVSTREGITPVKPDDLIMRGVSGEEYPIGREIFEKTYRIVEHPAPAVEKAELLPVKKCPLEAFFALDEQFEAMEAKLSARRREVMDDELLDAALGKCDALRKQRDTFYNEMLRYQDELATVKREMQDLNIRLGLEIGRKREQIDELVAALELIADGDGHADVIASQTLAKLGTDQGER